MRPFVPHRWIYAWLQHRNMEAQAEVAWSIAGCYLSFYITQVGYRVLCTVNGMARGAALPRAGPDGTQAPCPQHQPYP